MGALDSQQGRTGPVSELSRTLSAERMPAAAWVRPQAGHRGSGGRIRDVLNAHGVPGPQARALPEPVLQRIRLSHDRGRGRDGGARPVLVHHGDPGPRRHGDQLLGDLHRPRHRLSGRAGLQYHAPNTGQGGTRAGRHRIRFHRLSSGHATNP
jgi:hypothetical protein